jgi:uncharacterized protein YecE (DUF72 family)
MVTTTERGDVRIGCSGWSYDDWRGVVYPEDLPRRRWFEHYSSLFDTVELNATFYRLPDPATVERWAAAAPHGFVYSVKLGAFGTHRMKLRDAASWLPNHLDRIDRLGSSLGPTVVQLPPRWRKDLGRLDEFLEVAPRRYRWAVELREESWLGDDVFALLARHGAALCIHDLLPRHPLVLTTDWTYLRFHGPHALADPYRGAYTGRRLGRLATVLDGWLERGVDVYGYFNNDHEGHAVRDATWLRQRLLRPAVGAINRARTPRT